MAATLHCAMTEVSQCQNRTIIEFLVKKYTEKRYYKGIYLNFFIFSVLYQAAILDFYKQNTNEAAKLNELPVEN